MPAKIVHPPEAIAVRKWSNRFLAASLFGILFFTLFPYWFDFTSKHSPGRSPFLLSRPLGFDGFLHTFLNMLLFVPFGFALSQIFGSRRRTLLKLLTLAVLAGAALSYSIEILQLYMPTRDSAWDDVLANTLGSLVGMAIGLISGQLIFGKLSAWERNAEQFLSLRKITITALIYFAVWFVISIPLQQKTHLNNWDPNSYLIVGYDVREGTRWPGAVSLVQLWDHAVATDQAIGLTGSAASREKFGAEPYRRPLASYNLAQASPISSGTGFLPSLTNRPITTLPAKVRPSRRNDASSVLMSDASVPSLSAAVHESNQVAILVDCVPSRGNDRESATFAVANLSGESDLVFRQDGSSLAVSLRNGLNSRKALLAWMVPDVFTANVRHSILFSYDGAQGFLYIDGRTVRKSYYLGPGAALVGTLIRIKTDELVAYSGLYDSLVFLPIGFLLGFAVRIMPRGNTIYRLGICAGIFLPGILMECLLVGISGRPPSILQLSLTIGLTVAGTLWMNLDSSRPE
jgi:glycopeptide antibiotics resistance protein